MYCALTLFHSDMFDKKFMNFSSLYCQTSLPIFFYDILLETLHYNSYT